MHGDGGLLALEDSWRGACARSNPSESGILHDCAGPAGVDVRHVACGRRGVRAALAVCGGGVAGGGGAPLGDICRSSMASWMGARWSICLFSSVMTSAFMDGECRCDEAGVQPRRPPIFTSVSKDLELRRPPPRQSIPTPGAQCTCSRHTGPPWATLSRLHAGPRRCTEASPEASGWP